MTKVDIAFLMDRTGSQYPCIAELRRSLNNTVNRLLNKNPELRVALIAFGDYADTPYTHGFCDTVYFTNKVNHLQTFIDSVTAMGGGDAPEAYEFALWQAKSLDWRDDAVKVAVVVGDEVPHDSIYAKMAIGQEIDWRKEAQSLSRQNVNLYSVQCLNKKANTWFYDELANVGNGYKLNLDQFSNIAETVEMIGHKQSGDEALIEYQKELESAGTLNRSLAAMVDTLLRKKNKTFRIATDLDAVEPGRFQILHVDNKVDIKGFVQSTGARFEKGKGFYQLTKTEDIQAYKEIVLQDKQTGDLYSGTKARELVGLPVGANAHFHPVSLQKYNVFVQSTSVNRKLMPHTLFLYEVGE